MADPLSIVASVITLIQVSAQVTVLLKQFRDEVNVVDATLNGLLSDVQGLFQVLEAMKETFEQDEIKDNLQVTGHVGTHWKNLARSMKEGTATLQQLRGLLDNVNKTTSFLDGPRKQIRFKSAIDQITEFRERIQSYRSALQLSLNTVILWNQVIFQKSTEQIPAKLQPHLDKLYSEFRSFGSLLNAKIEKLQGALDLKDQQELTYMRNLRETVKSAADVASTASSTLTVEPVDRASVRYGSDFGDIFTKEANVTMKRWMDANTVYEYDDVEAAALPPESSAGDAVTEYQSDSDSDIETEMIKALFESARKKKDDGDLLGAERLFRNCLTRVSGNASFTSLRSAAAHSIPKYEILQSLTETYVQLELWGDATSTMRERLMIIERQVGKKDEKFFWETKMMAEMLMHNQEYVEAQLHGRRALKGFKKLGQPGFEGYEKCLTMLVEISQIDGKVDDRDAYAALLTLHHTKIQRKGSLKRAGSQKIQRISSVKRANSLKKFESGTSENLSSDSMTTLVPTVSLLSLQSGSSETATALTSSTSDLSLASGLSESTASLATVASDHSQQTEIPEEHAPQIPALNMYEPFHVTVEDHQSDHSDHNTSTPVVKEPKTEKRSAANSPIPTDVGTDSLESNQQVETQPVASIPPTLESPKETQAETKASESGSNKLNEEENVPIIARPRPRSAAFDQPAPPYPRDVERSSPSKMVSKYSGTKTWQELKKSLHDDLQVRIQDAIARSQASGVAADTPTRPKSHPGEAASDTQNQTEPHTSRTASDTPNRPRSHTSEPSSDAPNKSIKQPWIRQPLPYLASISLPDIIHIRRLWPEEVIQVLLAFSEHVTRSRSKARFSTEPWEIRHARWELDTAKEVVSEFSAPPPIFISLDHHLPQTQEETPLRRAVSDSYMARPRVTFEDTPIVIGEGDEDTENSNDPRPDGTLLSPIMATVGWGHRRSASTSATLTAPPAFEFYQLESEANESGLEVHEPEWVPGDDSATRRISDDGLIAVDDVEENPENYGRSLVRPGGPVQNQPICPICNNSLAGLSAESIDVHVNSCLDNPPVVTAQDTGGTERNSHDVSRGVRFRESIVDDSPIKENVSWRCCSPSCSLKNRLLPNSQTVCPRCGHFKDGMCTVSDVECPLPAPFWIPLDPVDPDQQGQNLRRKLVLLGDTLCGKTRLTESWKTGEHHQMIDQYANTGSISETFIKTVYIEGVEVELVAWDNSGLDDRNYEMLRRLSYKDVHVIFICFDIGDEDAAVDNVQHMWNPEAAEYLRDVPKILVGCKSDLRDTRHPGELVSKAQGVKLAREINALAYFETSAVTRAGVEEVFEYAAKTALVKGAPKKKGIRRFLSRADFKLKV